MSTFDNAVSIHPYFKVKEGQLEAAKAFIVKFCEKVVNEEKCFFYNFTFQGDVMCCREAYHDASGVQAHLENVGDLLGQFMELADLTRIELQGPAGELEKLKARGIRADRAPGGEAGLGLAIADRIADSHGGELVTCLPEYSGLALRFPDARPA